MITYFILGAFLLGTLVLGLWAGKDVKTMKDYVLAGRLLSTGVLTMTFVATFFSGADLLDIPIGMFRTGMIEIIFIIFYVVSFIMMGIFVAPKMVFYTDCLTGGDLIKKFYGRSASFLVGIASLVLSVLVLSAQVRSILYINSNLLNLPSMIILSIVLMIVCYTAIGGMRAVAYTDVLQLIIGTLTLVAFTSVLLYQIGGLKGLFNQLPKEKLTGYSSIFVLKRLRSAFYWAGIPTFVCTPPMIMRMLVPARKDHVKNMFFAAAPIYTFLAILLSLIGLGTLVYCSDTAIQEEVLKTRSLIGYMATVLFANHTLLQVCLFIGMLFVILSTMDSFLQASGIVFVRDCIKPFFDTKKIPINELKWARWATVLIGSLVCFSNVLNTNLNVAVLGSLDSYKYAVITYGMIIVPLIVGILGLKTDKKSFWLFCTTFVIAMVVTSLLTTLHNYTIFFISMGLATLLFFISHYIINQGFVTVQRTHQTTGHKLWLPSWRGFATILASCIPTPSRLAKIAQRKVGSYGNEPFLFSLFFICASPIILLNIPQAPSNLYMTALVFGIAITLCCGLMLEVKWLSWLKPYFPLYWFFTLLYCLPFAGTLLFLTNVASSTAVVSLGLAWFLLMLCVDWKSFFILAFLGTGLASGVYGYVTGSFWPMMDFNEKWNFYLAVMAVLTACFLFAQRKERYNKVQLQKANLYAGSIAHETKNYLGASQFAGLRLKDAIQKKQFKALDQGDLYTIPKQLAEELMFLGPELEEGASQSLSKIDMFMSALKENIISTKLSVSSIKACVEQALKDSYFKSEEVRKGLVLRLDDDFKAKVSEGFFKHVIYNLVKNAYWHGGATKVVITLDNAKRSLCVEDNGRGIDSVSLPYIFDLFYSGGSGNGIGLALVKVIVESFGGSIHCDSKQGENSYTKFVVYFPEGV